MLSVSKWPFYAKLTIALVSVFLATFLFFLYLGLIHSQAYLHEVNQKLHRNLGNYIVDHQKSPFINEDGSVNHRILEDIAMHTMMINPMVEIYLIDSKGKILGHALHKDDVKLSQVSLQPVYQFLEHRKNDGAVLGDNPRDPEARNIFSVAPIILNNQDVGYLYVVLNSHEAMTIREQLNESYVLKVAAGIFAVFSLLAMLIALLIFHSLTQPLRHLSEKTRLFRHHVLMKDIFEKKSKIEPIDNTTNDEIRALDNAFDEMRSKLLKQFDELQKTDALRRELISNISHDLRTPLVSIQGFIEKLF